MRYTAPLGWLAIVLIFVAACGDMESTPTPSTTQESPGTSASTSIAGHPEVTPPPSAADMELAAQATWVLESLDGRPIIEESVITLRIGDNWFDGIDGCNSYGGRSEDGKPVAGADGVFSIPSFGVTEMLCPEPEGIMDQADAYISALAQGERFRVVDARLEILDSGGAAGLVFVRRAPLPGSPTNLEGTAWRLLEAGDADGDVPPPTMAFLDDRLVTGATACRSYVATYRASEGALRFPGTSMVRSQQSCEGNARALEAEFTDFLTWAREYSVDKEGGSSRLRIWSIRGKTLTFEPLPQAVEDIADTEWYLMAFVELRQGESGTWHHRTTSVVDGTEVTTSFDEDGLGGLSGCNSYAGPARFEDGSITVNVQLLHSTAMLCEGPDGLMEQEERYFGLVQRMTRYGIYGDGLFMQTADDVFLLFRQAEAHIDDDESMSQGVELTAIDTHYDNNAIYLWWEDPDWEVDYWVVERSVSQDGPWMAIAVKRPGELRPQEKLPQYDRWADGKLPVGERYYYRIYSCTESGRSGYSNVASGVVPEFMPGLEPPIEAKEAVEPPC